MLDLLTLIFLMSSSLKNLPLNFSKNKSSILDSMKNLFLILFLFVSTFKAEAFDLIIEPGIGLQHQGDIFFNDYNDTVAESDDSHVAAPVKNHISILTVDFGLKYQIVSLGFRGEWSG